MDKEISDSIDANLRPWPNAWAESPASELFHSDSYEQLLPRYTTRVWHYSVLTLSSMCFR
jgi:phosphoglucomutase